LKQKHQLRGERGAGGITGPPEDCDEFCTGVQEAQNGIYTLLLTWLSKITGCLIVTATLLHWLSTGKFN